MSREGEMAEKTYLNAEMVSVVHTMRVECADIYTGIDYFQLHNHKDHKDRTHQMEMKHIKVHNHKHHGDISTDGVNFWKIVLGFRIAPTNTMMRFFPNFQTQQILLGRENPVGRNIRRK